MAFGDISVGDVDEVIDGDGLRVTFTSGPRAGTSWRVRLLGADAYELRGLNRYLGQSALEVAQDWVSAFAGRVEVTEAGVDQFGRLVCEVRDQFNLSELDAEMVGSGLAVGTTVSGTPPVILVESDPRLNGVGFGGPLEVDTTIP